MSSSFDTLDSLEQKRLLEKLAKLKALSECPTGNVNETATAAATMMRIMLEYQIQMADVDLASGSTDLDVIEETLTPEGSLNGFPRWKSSLLRTLAEVNGCECYKSSKTEYELWSRQTSTHLLLIGTESDIENTRRLFFFCVHEVDRLCKAWGKGQPVKQKNDFKIGASAGIANKVRSERKKVLAEELARSRAQDVTSAALELFGRKDQAVQAFVERLNLRRSTVYARRPSEEAYHSGYQAGLNLDLSHGTRPLLSS